MSLIKFILSFSLAVGLITSCVHPPKNQNTPIYQGRKGVVEITPASQPVIGSEQVSSTMRARIENSSVLEDHYGQSSSYRVPKNADASIHYYTNVYGNRVQAPTNYNAPPAGACAQCEDGTYSFSQNRRGTCSRHGGVRVWLR